MKNLQSSTQNNNEYGYLKSLNEIVKIDIISGTMTKNAHSGRFKTLQDISESTIIDSILIDRSKNINNGFCILIETGLNYILSKTFFPNYDKKLSKSGNFYIYTNPYQFSNAELYGLGLYSFFEHCIIADFNAITYVSEESYNNHDECGQEYAEYEYAYGFDN